MGLGTSEECFLLLSPPRPPPQHRRQHHVAWDKEGTTNYLVSDQMNKWDCSVPSERDSWKAASDIMTSSCLLRMCHMLSALLGLWCQIDLF